MNPVGYPGDRLPGQPAGSTVVQHTTVNINSEPPKDHIIWSLCCFAYSNPCCLGLVALIFSVKARDRKVVGDLEGARHYGSTARCLNIWATVLVSIMFLIAFIITIIMVVKANEIRRTYNTNNFSVYHRG